MSEELKHADFSPEVENGWLAGLLQVSDPLFPTGAYAHSMGLEQWAASCDYQSADDLVHFFQSHAGRLWRGWSCPTYVSCGRR